MCYQDEAIDGKYVQEGWGLNVVATHRVLAVPVCVCVVCAQNLHIPANNS